MVDDGIREAQPGRAASEPRLHRRVDTLSYVPGSPTNESGMSPPVRRRAVATSCSGVATPARTSESPRTTWSTRSRSPARSRNVWDGEVIGSPRAGRPSLARRRTRASTPETRSLEPGGMTSWMSGFAGDHPSPEDRGGVAGHQRAFRRQQQCRARSHYRGRRHPGRGVDAMEQPLVGRSAEHALGEARVEAALERERAGERHHRYRRATRLPEASRHPQAARAFVVEMSKTAPGTAPDASVCGRDATSRPPGRRH